MQPLGSRLNLGIQLMMLFGIIMGLYSKSLSGKGPWNFIVPICCLLPRCQWDVTGLSRVTGAPGLALCRSYVRVFILLLWDFTVSPQQRSLRLPPPKKSVGEGILHHLNPWAIKIVLRDKALPSKTQHLCPSVWWGCLLALVGISVKQVDTLLPAPTFRQQDSGSTLSTQVRTREAKCNSQQGPSRQNVESELVGGAWMVESLLWKTLRQKTWHNCKIFRFKSL